MTKPIQISLAAARVNAGLTQKHVGEVMHVSPNTIVSWEKGKTAPTVPQMQELCRMYKMPFDAIFVPDKSN